MKCVNDKLNSEIKKRIEDYLVDNKEILDSFTHMDGVPGGFEFNESQMSILELIRINIELGPILNISNDDFFMLIKEVLRNTITKTSI